MSLLKFFEPWEPSSVLVVIFVAAAVLFARGTRRVPVKVGFARQAMFWTGLALLYVAMHTRVDYYAEHQFFVHRLQHLVLHHLGPFVLMGAYPASVLRAGLPLAWRRALRRWEQSATGRAIAAVVLNPAFISVAFVVSVVFWLIPSVQFVAMLDWRIYTFMNWSVAASGLLYWSMLLDRRPSPPSRTRPGLRVLSPVITMTPQILVGAIITFSARDLYPVFTLCGRAFTSVPVALDQSLGGLIMWVPAGVIEAIGAMIALRNLMRISTLPGRVVRKAQRKGFGAPAVPQR
ncbi:putative membrane protein [Paraburkholderia caballeronis]|uniref:cytochrome c oxidase assembly protein n=1 Tax=Paraburkholderia caballeronis TaxID=416943 RepID=UPI001066F78C|nr:cytochrome c oxidase assembly protein [Paraburkholderia caballeronis]TDV35855.1 putative membrane protein [Paraburkholderia caballeronis]